MSPRERVTSFNDAILEATLQAMKARPSLAMFGCGITDPKAIFGTTRGLAEAFPSRVIETPVSENALTGVALGYALAGGSALLVHQRVDFMLSGMDQLVNNVAKWRSMFGTAQNVPVVIRAIVGQGWGQGNQHSQNFEALFAQLPGLSVVTPSTPYSAKGLLFAALMGNEPVVFLEHRWLQEVRGHVPRRAYRLAPEPAVVLKPGRHVTLVASGYWTLECLRAATFLETTGIAAEVVDVRCLSRLDAGVVLRSVRKTGALLVVNGSWPSFGMSSEILARLMLARARSRLDVLSFPAAYVPSAHAAANRYYPNVGTIVKRVQKLLGASMRISALEKYMARRVLDQPDYEFIPEFPSR